MSHDQMTRRRRARRAAQIGCAWSAAMLVLSLGAALQPSSAAAQVTGAEGPATVVGGPGTTSGVALTTGGSATSFALQVPAGAACTGDSASGGYRIQSYMVPASVDPSTLTFGLQGPTPQAIGAAYRQPLFTVATTRYVNITTGVAPTPGAGGPVPSTGGFNFAAAPFAGGTAVIPAGTYNVGLACTLGSSNAPVDKFWNVQMTFAADAADQPSGLRWTVEAAPTATTTTTTTTTSTTTTTTTVPGTATTTTTTVAGGATTTTVATGATTTTTIPAGATTSSTIATGVASGGGSTGGTGAAATGATSGGAPRTLPATGSPVPAIVVWALLVLVLGRMAVLLGRRPGVVGGLTP